MRQRLPFAILTTLIPLGSGLCLLFQAWFIRPKILYIAEYNQVVVPVGRGMEWAAFLVRNASMLGVLLLILAGVVLLAWVLVLIRRAESIWLCWSSCVQASLAVVLLVASAMGAWLHLHQTMMEMSMKALTYRRVLEDFSVAELAAERHEKVQEVMRRYLNVEHVEVEDPVSLPIKRQREIIKRYAGSYDQLGNQAMQGMVIATLLQFDSTFREHRYLADRLIKVCNQHAGREFSGYEEAYAWAKQAAQQNNWQRLPIFEMVYAQSQSSW